eukprot:7040009-Lingulodinium_polyedra.AAC.1
MDLRSGATLDVGAVAPTVGGISGVRARNAPETVTPLGRRAPLAKSRGQRLSLRPRMGHTT